MSLNLQFQEPTTEAAPPPMGHNAGRPTDWAELLDPEGLRLLLEVEWESLMTRRDSLIKLFAEFKLKNPQGVASEEAAKSATDIGAQIKAAAKLVEQNRVIVKGPFLEADKTVQKFFLGILNPLNDAVKSLESSISAFTRVRAETARRLAQEEADRKAAEAERLAEVAIDTGNADLMEQADMVANQAGIAARSAAAPIAKFSQTRGDYGQSSGRKRYIFRVTDLSKVPLKYLTTRDSDIARDINGKDRVTEIPGIEIEEEFKTTIRA